jgi:hypothetical protein
VTADNADGRVDDGLYKTELIEPSKPWKTIQKVEIATCNWSTG